MPRQAKPMRQRRSGRVERYEVRYFAIDASNADEVRLFKKVDHQGRGRPEIFALDGGRWVPALGLRPLVWGGPEWDPRARPLEAEAARAVLAAVCSTAQEVDDLLDDTRGQRQERRD